MKIDSSLVTEMMDNLTSLNGRFGIPGKISFRENSLGLVVADISNDQASASIALYGAQILAWAPRKLAPVIWMSEVAKYIPGKSLRGGIPICWPWFGPHPTNTTYPAHGVARGVMWEVMETRSLDNGATRIVFSMPNATRNYWPHDTTLEYYVDVGTTLEIDLVTTNRGSQTVTIGQALHTYFIVSDIRQVRIHGLENNVYIDKVDNGMQKKQSDAITISEETDRIYLDAIADCVIDDSVTKRRIRIAKRGSRSTVVWNPWAEKNKKLGDMGEEGYLTMVCVETTNADQDVITLARGQKHHLWTGYSIEGL